MHKIITTYPITSLLATALLCGILWRVEVEYHGWAGLIWLSYFHCAIPVGFALFLLWANQLIDMGQKRRAAFNLVAVLYGVFAYFGLQTSLVYTFASGMYGLVLGMHTSEWQLYFFRYLPFVILPFLPIGAYLILTAFGKKTAFRYLIAATIGMMISLLLSTAILQVIDHRGGHDYVHIVKSGIIIPFGVLSIGLVLVGQRINNNDAEHSSNTECER